MRKTNVTDEYYADLVTLSANGFSVVLGLGRAREDWATKERTQTVERVVCMSLQTAIALHEILGTTLTKLDEQLKKAAVSAKKKA